MKKINRLINHLTFKKTLKDKFEKYIYDANCKLYYDDNSKRWFSKSLDKPIISLMHTRKELFHTTYNRGFRAHNKLSKQILPKVSIPEFEKQRAGEINCYLKFIQDESLEHIPQWTESNWVEIERYKFSN
jgi:hypothetical protein